nr:glycogen [starch] synthase, muscle [Pelodiscus sinensis]|eukprot:XP_025045488.1 glycogen [starch] synthase, muscle [Pelodiscus sinensis]
MRYEFNSTSPLKTVTSPHSGCFAPIGFPTSLQGLEDWEDEIDLENAILFEVAWEVANKGELDLPVATIFTTHATLLGRYLCAGSVDFYNNLHNVSEGTAPARAGRALETWLPNLLPALTTRPHSLHRARGEPRSAGGLGIQRFLSPRNLDFNLDKTLFFFIAGRYEFSNKGADIFLEALARLNYLLRVNGSQVTIVAFFIMPARTNNFNVETLKGQAVRKQLCPILNAWPLLLAPELPPLRECFKKPHSKPSLSFTLLALDFASCPFASLINFLQSLLFEKCHLSVAPTCFIVSLVVELPLFLLLLCPTGIYILDRRFRALDDSCTQLTSFLYSCWQQSRRQRIIQRNRTERLSDLLDWKYLGRPPPQRDGGRRRAVRRRGGGGEGPAEHQAPGHHGLHPGVAQTQERLQRGQHLVQCVVPPSPSISRHSSPHHSETEDDDERYDEEEEAEKDRQNIKPPATMGSIPEWRKPKKGSSEASTSSNASNASTPTLPSSPSDLSSPTSSIIEERN